MLLGADIGGTFTDIVWWTGTELVTHKVSTTPARPEDALLAGIEELAANRADVLVVHGSTVATNALLERKGARVTLVTTAGFADVLEIGRQNRIGIYDPRAVKPAPLVPAERRIEASERLDADGTPLLALEDAESRALRGPWQSSSRRRSPSVSSTPTPMPRTNSAPARLCAPSRSSSISPAMSIPPTASTSARARPC